MAQHQKMCYLVAKKFDDKMDVVANIRYIYRIKYTISIFIISYII